MSVSVQVNKSTKSLYRAKSHVTSSPSGRRDVPVANGNHGDVYILFVCNRVKILNLLEREK